MGDYAAAEARAPTLGDVLPPPPPPPDGMPAAAREACTLAVRRANPIARACMQHDPEGFGIVTEQRFAVALGEARLDHAQTAAVLDVLRAGAHDAARPTGGAALESDGAVVQYASLVTDLTRALGQGPTEASARESRSRRETWATSGARLSLARTALARASALRNMFWRCDRTGSGALSIEELERLLRCPQAALPPHGEEARWLAEDAAVFAGGDVTTDALEAFLAVAASSPDAAGPPDFGAAIRAKLAASPSLAGCSVESMCVRLRAALRKVQGAIGPLRGGGSDVVADGAVDGDAAVAPADIPHLLKELGVRLTEDEAAYALGELARSTGAVDPEAAVSMESAAAWLYFGVGGGRGR